MARSSRSGTAVRRHQETQDAFYHFKCADCGKGVKRRVHRGRKATRCQACREVAKPESTPIASIICADCKKPFTPKRHTPIPPKRCPGCREKLRVQKEADRIKAHEVTINCEQCGTDFIHERQRGKTPKRCPECRAKDPVKPKPVLHIDPEPITANYKAAIDALKEKYGGDIHKVPRRLIAKEQENLRRAWCEAYQKPWGGGR